MVSKKPLEDLIDRERSPTQFMSTILQFIRLCSFFVTWDFGNLDEFLNTHCVVMMHYLQQNCKHEF